MKISLLLSAIFISVILYAEVDFQTGIIGLTRLNGEGCLCHDVNNSDSVHVWIEGPDSLLVNSIGEYKLFMNGGPAVAGGFNIAAMYGELSSTDTLTQTILNTADSLLELTHTMPNNFVNDTVSWDFLYMAPDSIGTDTLYSVANSVDLNGNPLNDHWNFGENFPVTIYSIPVNVENESSPVEYSLSQNYPNPFNPSTKIRFTIAPPNLPKGEAFVSLKVYDVLGNEVATLVSEEKPAGRYTVEFDGSNLSSGIYLYQIIAGNFVQTKKMILLK